MKIFQYYILSFLLLFTSCINDETKNHTNNQKSHDEIMEEINSTINIEAEIKSIGILVYDGVNSLDALGPRYVLGQAMGVTTQLVGIKPGAITTVMGVQIIPDTVIDSISQLDILLIPGGSKGTIETAYNHKVLDWIRKINNNSIITASVCTGSIILGESGLLKGKKASGNWFKEEELLTKNGAIHNDARWTQDGKFWTSSGVTAGLDMSLAILESIKGRDYAQAVMLDMEYDPSPPFEGGSPENTKPEVYQMMYNMYDAGFTPLIDSLESSSTK